MEKKNALVNDLGEQFSLPRNTPALRTEKYKRCINILLLIIMGTRQILFLGQPKKAGNVAGEGASPCGTTPVSPNGT